LHRQPLDFHTQDGAGHLFGLIGRLCQFDAPGLAAPADQDLALDDNRLANPFGDSLCLGWRGGDVAIGDGNAIVGEDAFRLILV